MSITMEAGGKENESENEDGGEDELGDDGIEEEALDSGKI
jgi:hypothetical protein